MHHLVSRRKMLLAGGAVAGQAVWATPRGARAAPVADIQEAKVISHRAHLYHGWPTITRRQNGQLLVVCSGGREAHVCPFGRVELIRLNDDGRMWTWPQVIMDSGIDDRDAGVLETSQGTILISTDGPSTDLGYPSTVQLGDASLLTVWYEVMPGSPHAVLRQARWSLNT